MRRKGNRDMQFSHDNQRGRMRCGLFAILFLTLALMMAVPCMAAKKNTFVKKSGKYYYYNEKGKKAKGLTKIGSKTYYFDSSGVQRTSWRLIDGYYYCFRSGNGAKGYMYKSTWVDGIYVNKKGRATGSGDATRKLRVMAKAALIVDSVISPAAAKADKRQTMFTYTMKHYKNVVIPDLVRGQEHWDVAYAEYLFNRGAGDCYAFAAGYAYFMNAIGYQGVTMEHSGTHAWVHWGDYYYDPHWATSYGSSISYHVPEYLSGVGGRPHWAEILISMREIDEF